MVENVSLDLIIKPLKSEIQSVARSKRFIDWQESGSFSASLGHILFEIEKQLLKQHPQQAIKLLDSRDARLFTEQYEPVSVSVPLPVF